MVNISLVKYEIIKEIEKSLRIFMKIKTIFFAVKLQKGTHRDRENLFLITSVPYKHAVN